MTYDREDATRLAYNVLRKRSFDQERERRERQLDATHVDPLTPLLRSLSGSSKDPLTFKNPDLSYLAGRSRLKPSFLRRMVGWFGEPTVLEALRRYDPTWAEAYFVGVCRNVEKEAHERPSD